MDIADENRNTALMLAAFENGVAATALLLKARAGTSLMVECWANMAKMWQTYGFFFRSLLSFFFFNI